MNTKQIRLNAMNTKQIRLNAMRKVRNEVAKYFGERVKMFISEEQHLTARTQRREGLAILRFINNIMEKEKTNGTKRKN